MYSYEGYPATEKEEEIVHLKPEEFHRFTGSRLAERLIDTLWFLTSQQATIQIVPIAPTDKSSSTWLYTGKHQNHVNGFPPSLFICRRILPNDALVNTPYLLGFSQPASDPSPRVVYYTLDQEGLTEQPISEATIQIINPEIPYQTTYLSDNLTIPCVSS